ncbi:MAG: SDR family oxidoreductase [Gemmatimonadota bacterium]
MGQVLIAGCGYVGSQAALFLLEEDRDVVGLRRNVAAIPPSIPRISADLVSGTGLDAVPEDVDQLLYAASPGDRSEEAYQQAYLDGPARLRELFRARDQVIRRAVLLSSTGVYGDAEGAWVDEETPPRPDTITGQVLDEAEMAFLEKWQGIGVVLRLGGIYGPGRTRLLEMVRSGRARCPEGDTVYSNRIHRDDAARASVFLLDHPTASGVYLGVDEEPADLCSLYRWMASELGVPAPTPGGIERTRSNKRCSGARLRRLGFSYSFPTFRQGYSELLPAGGDDGGQTGS